MEDRRNMQPNTPECSVMPDDTKKIKMSVPKGILDGPTAIHQAGEYYAVQNGTLEAPPTQVDAFLKRGFKLVDAPKPAETAKGVGSG